MADAFIYKPFILIGWALLLVALGVGFAYRHYQLSQFWPRWGRNLALAGMNGGLSIIWGVPVALWASMGSFSPLANLRGQGEYAYFWLAFDFVVLDLLLYIWHRLNHKLPILWRFHQVHHFDRHLDITTALRFHFGEVFLSSLFRAPFIMLLGIEFTHILWFEALMLIFVMFHHANIHIKGAVQSALAWVIVTPSWHYRHHQPKQVYTDSNYGVIFTFWDRLLASATTSLPSQTQEFGIEGQRQDRPLLRLLALPFGKQG